MPHGHTVSHMVGSIIVRTELSSIVLRVRIKDDDDDRCNFCIFSDCFKGVARGGHGAMPSSPKLWVIFPSVATFIYGVSDH